MNHSNETYHKFVYNWGINITYTHKHDVYVILIMWHKIKFKVIVQVATAICLYKLFNNVFNFKVVLVHLSLISILYFILHGKTYVWNI